MGEIIKMNKILSQKLVLFTYMALWNIRRKVVNAVQEARTLILPMQIYLRTIYVAQDV